MHQLDITLHFTVEKNDFVKKPSFAPSVLVEVVSLEMQNKNEEALLANRHIKKAAEEFVFCYVDRVLDKMIDEDN